MKVYLASLGIPLEHSSVPRFAQQLAGQRQPRRHQRVDDPREADIVLFTERHLLAADWTLRSVRTSEVARRFRSKVCVYNGRDRPWRCLPGVYVSMPASGFVPRWQVAGSYYAIEPPADRIGVDPADIDHDLLFSFVGGTTHRCREDIFRLDASRAYGARTDDFLFHNPRSGRFEELRRRFAEVTLRSKFVLCPRGHGTSSFRLDETLSAGRVPVIIADGSVPPAGPNWDAIAIRWPEVRISELPGYLREHESAAIDMGRRAGAAFAGWFAQDVVLSHQLDQLERLAGSEGFARFRSGGYKNTQYFRALRGAVRARAKRLRDDC